MYIESSDNAYLWGQGPGEPQCSNDYVAVDLFVHDCTIVNLFPFSGCVLSKFSLVSLLGA